MQFIHYIDHDNHYIAYIFHNYLINTFVSFLFYVVRPTYKIICFSPIPGWKSDMWEGWTDYIMYNTPPIKKKKTKMGQGKKKRKIYFSIT